MHSSPIASAPAALVLGAGTVGAATAAVLRAGSAGPVVRIGRTSGDRRIDLRDPDATADLAAGASTLYLTAGLPYRSAVWERDWPSILRNVIASSIHHRARLVFFDNVYAYGPVATAMTEQTPIRPTSRKGTVRAALAAQLDRAGERGLDYAIVRSADFYGPGAETSVFTTMAARAVARGKRPLWLFDADQPHSMTYVPDIARALVTVGTAPALAQRVWHVPTAPALTGREYARLLGGGEIRVLTEGMTRAGALFSADARESLELSYQSLAPHVFDGSAFTTEWGMAPTPVSEGIAATLRSELAALRRRHPRKDPK